MSSPSNFAAFLTAPQASPLEVKEAPYTSPGENEILLRNKAIALNSIDWTLAFTPAFGPNYLNYPHVGGQDVAGEVVEVGPGVTGFKSGDRVLGQSAGIISRRTADGAFQNYTILKSIYATVIPENISFESAAAIPLTFATSSVAFYSPDILNLPLPSVAPTPAGKTIIIWGGASGVGSSAIQLAVASGLEVITTASPKNFDLVRRLGAKHVFDYKSSEIASELAKAVEDKEMAGAFLAIKSDEALKTVISVLEKAQGAKIIATVNPRATVEVPEDFIVKGVFGVIKDPKLASTLFGGYLGPALEQGSFVPAPEAQVVGHGLDTIQKGLELLNKGVSAKKLVVTL